MERLWSRVHPLVVLVLAGAVLLAMHRLDRWFQTQITLQSAAEIRYRQINERSAQAREHMATLRDLKESDLNLFKEGFSNQAVSRKTLFESGLSLQEERRLLDKQLEIMTTYLLINPQLQRVILMRGEQALQGYLINYIPPKAFGVPDSLPPVVRIVSKERFAHPERGHSEEVNGHLQYMPPQVGTSVRSNALGEFVIFTNSKLILHGPPLNEEDHEKFPHICLGLDRDAARKLYRGTFIGTKIIINGMSGRH